MEPIVVSAGLYLIFLCLCWWRPAAARVVVGVFFGVMGVLVNGLIAAIAPQLFVDLAAQAPWNWYRALGLTLVESFPMAFGVFMMLFEVGVAIMILSRNRLARIVGLLTAAVFLIGITPLGVYTLVNPLLAAGCVFLAWAEHQELPTHTNATSTRNSAIFRRRSSGV